MYHFLDRFSKYHENIRPIFVLIWINNLTSNYLYKYNKCILGINCVGLVVYDAIYWKNAKCKRWYLIFLLFLVSIHLVYIN